MVDFVAQRVYSCCKCRNHVALHDDIVSTAFQSKNGRAILFAHAQNVYFGVEKDRQMITGLHSVMDVHCADCKEILGWRYEKAYEESQKYKEGKLVLERYKIVKQDW